MHSLAYYGSSMLQHSTSFGWMPQGWRDAI